MVLFVSSAVIHLQSHYSIDITFSYSYIFLSYLVSLFLVTLKIPLCTCTSKNIIYIGHVSKVPQSNKMYMVFAIKSSQPTSLYHLHYHSPCILWILDCQNIPTFECFAMLALWYKIICPSLNHSTSDK